MSRAVDRELHALFDQAERRGLCLVSTSSRLGSLLRRRLTQGGWIQSPRRGYFVRTDWWEGLSRDERDLCVLRTYAEAHPGTAFCSFSAAIVHGLPVHIPLRDRIHVLGAHSRKRGDVVSHVREAPGIEEVGGLRVSGIVGTVVDTVGAVPFSLGLPLADAALSVSMMERDDFLGRIATLPKGLRGIRRCRKTMSYADPRSESGGESYARAVMIELGFQAPELQVVFPNPLEPGKTFRIDYVWALPDGSLIFGEFDGKGKYSDAGMLSGRTAVDAFMDERQREALLTLYRARVVRFGYRQVRDRESFRNLLLTYGVPMVE